MATIPMGPGRRVMPTRSPAQGVDTAAFGMQSARAVEQIGNTGANIALGEMDDARRQQQAEARERQQLADAADRQRQLLTLNQTKDQLRDAHDELVTGIAQGTVEKDQAEATWADRTKTIVGESTGQFSEQFRELAVRDLTGTGLTLGNSVRKAREQRDRQDVTAGIDQTLEYAQRQYKVDPAGAQKMAADTLAQLGPFSRYTPEQIAAKGQAWKEGVQFTQGFEAVSAGRTDRKALADAEKLIAELPDLDPQRRVQLSDRAQAYRLHLDQQDEMRAQRRQREADAHLKRAEASFNTFQSMADKGTVLDPAYIDQVTRATAGTPYQQGVVALARQAVETGGLAAQPVASQQQALDSVNALIAKNGRSPALDKRKEQIEKVLSGSQEDLTKDGLRAGLERGVITEIRPIDFSQGLPAAIQQVQARIPQAQRVSVWAGRPVSVLTSDEASTLGEQLSTLQPRERSTMVAGLAKTMGPQASQALVQQLAPKDKALALAFGYAGQETTGGRLVSELILRGQQAQKDGTSTKGAKQPDLKAASWKADLAEQLRDVYPSQQQADQVLDAALLVTHSIAAEQGGELKDDDRARAVRLAVGGAVVELNGRNVPTPFAQDDAEAKLTRRLRSVSTQELAAQAPGGEVLAGGARMPLDEFVESLPGQQLIYAGQGRYGVLVGGRPVKNTAGRNVIIEVR